MRIVDVGAERFLDRVQIGLVAVRRELDAVGKAVLHVVHEGQRIFAVATADQPRNDQLAVAVERGPRPRVASAIDRLLHGRDVLLLRVGERPDFVALNALGLHVADFASWRSAQNLPASTSSLETVLIDTSATREIDRMDDPSQSMERIWTRFARGSLFMPLIYELLCLASSIKVHFRKSLLDEGPGPPETVP